MTRRRTIAGFLLAVVVLVATASSVLAQQQTPRIRAGGERRIQAVLTKRVDPVYPKEARAKRIQGTVVVEIVIGTDGRVIDAAVKKSVLLLDDTTLAAVRQWEYKPTILDGELVEVVTTLSVNFRGDAPRRPDPRSGDRVLLK